MATHAIGKLKFNLSDQGQAYRWGDGEVHRLFGGKKQAASDEDIENIETGADAGYADAYDAENDGYDDDYADDPGYERGGEDLLRLPVFRTYDHAGRTEGDRVQLPLRRSRDAGGASAS